MQNPLHEALQALPHGPAFRFVDELISLDPGREGVARYTLRGDEAFLAGHFPDHPIMPGVLLLEAIAQLGGVVAQSDPVHPPLAELRLTGIRAAKILGALVPGETFEIRAKVEARLGHLVQIDGSIWASGQQVASAKVALSGS